MMQIAHNELLAMKGGLTEIIRQAAYARNVIRITYTDAKGVTTVRKVEPYEFKGDKFFAYCVEKQGIRAFDLLKISHVEMTPELYEPRFEIKIL